MSEKDLFEYLKRYWADLKMSTDQYSKHDCFSESTNTRIELKCRKKHYNTLLLEKPKYDALIKESNKHFDVPIYINSTPEGIYLFNLNKIDLKWFEKSLPATSEFKNRRWIKKQVTEINIKQAIKLK